MTTHRDLLRWLVLLTVVRLLTSVVTSHSVPVRYALPRRHAPAAGPADPLTATLAVSRPARPRRDPGEVTPAGATGHGPDQLTGSQPGTGPPPPLPPPRRPTHRGRRSRRRGSRGGRVWRRGARTGELYIAQLNVQSVRPLGKRLELNSELATHGYDILILNETWLKPGVTNRFITVPGYQIVRADRPDGSGYGGVALVVRDGISVRTVPAPDRHNQRSKLETLWARVQCGASGSVLICAAYRPPHTSARQDDDDIDELDHQLQHMLINHGGMMLVVGDFNFDQSGRAAGRASDRFSALFSDCLMRQLITDTTYRPSGSVLDLIFTNQTASVIRAGTVHCNISPHNFTRAVVRLPQHRPPSQTTVTARRWAGLDSAELNRRLTDVDWTRCLIPRTQPCSGTTSSAVQLVFWTIWRRSGV